LLPCKEGDVIAKPQATVSASRRARRWRRRALEWSRIVESTSLYYVGESYISADNARSTHLLEEDPSFLGYPRVGILSNQSSLGVAPLQQRRQQAHGAVGVLADRAAAVPAGGVEAG